MAYSPAVTKLERRVLEFVARGHPGRVMTVSGGRVNALEWSEIKVALRLSESELGECVAHLGAQNLIDTGIGRPGLFRLFSGGGNKFFFWATEAGRTFLATTTESDLPDAEAPRSSHVRPEDIDDDAIRIVENSLSQARYVKQTEVTWAASVLDDDIKSEIKSAADALASMWYEFERRFGYRGAAKNEAQARFRDTVVIPATVQKLRAADEQRRRRGFGPSEKPPSWETRYHGGNIGLPPAPWESPDPDQ